MAPRPASQKRSRSARLALMGLAPFALVSCTVPTQDALLYRSAEDCIAGGQLSQAQCRSSYATAAAATESRAPRYARRADCVADFGEDGCRATPSGGYFLPFMSGYLIGRSGTAAQPFAQPLYRSRGGSWLTPGGMALAGQTGAVRVPAQALEPQRAVTMSRAGFGTRAAARGSWGG